MKQRSYPRIPIPSVGAIVVGTKGILLLRRQKPPYRDLWNIATGAVNLGETQQDAVAREVREETGITGEVMRFVDTGDVIIKDDDERVEYHFIVNVYLFRASSQEADSDIKINNAMWFHPSSLPSEEMVESVYKALQAMESQILQIMKMNQ